MCLVFRQFNIIIISTLTYKRTCVVMASGPQGSWSVYVCCLHLKMEFRSNALGGVSGVASFIFTEEQLQ